MKNLTAVFLIALSATAVAELPKPAPITRYTTLWTDSPFTTPPPPPAAGPEVNPLEDYSLGGVSPVSGGYRVTLLNKKNPEERIVIPDDPNFRLIAVQYAPGDPLGTTVRVSTGSKTGTVAFDKDMLVLKASAVAPQVQQNPNPQNPPGVPGQPPIPGQQQQNTEGQRPPRPRVVAPPAGNANGQPAPQVQGQQQQQVPGQQQNQRQNGQQRLNRR